MSDDIETLRPDSGEHAFLDLNTAHAVETSLLQPDAWRRLVRQAYAATCVRPDRAFLIAFTQDSDYDSPNFLWLKARIERFVYVDRIVVSATARGQGLARRLYEDLFLRAVGDQYPVVACEVNVDPPNPGSMAFHARLGFEEIATVHNSVSGKTVAYLQRRIGKIS